MVVANFIFLSKIEKVAIQDFSGKTECDLDLQRGDELVVLFKQGTWCYGAVFLFFECYDGYTLIALISLTHVKILRLHTRIKETSSPLFKMSRYFHSSHKFTLKYN